MIKVVRLGRKKDLTLCLGKKIEVSWDFPLGYWVFRDWVFQYGYSEEYKTLPGFYWIVILGLSITIYQRKTL